jgi:hypothetical protein
MFLLRDQNEHYFGIHKSLEKERRTVYSQYEKTLINS